MKRRDFMTATAGSALAGGVTGCKVQKIPARETGGGATAGLADRTLGELREEYRYWLFDDFLPFMDSYVIDHEYGGFMCNTDRDGTTISTGKRAWFEGRGIWVYSFLYNKLSQDPAHLEIARKSVEFIMPHRPEPGGIWPGSYSREGEAVSGPGDLYANLFIANGLAEYSRAPGNEQYWDTAKEILLDSMRIYDDPGYDYTVGYGPDIPTPEGARVLGHWMVIVRLVTQMLEDRNDPALEALAARCVEAIHEYHYNPEYGLMNEVLNHDLSRTDDAFNQFSYTGHAIETMWMLLYEAARTRDRALFDLTTERFVRHTEVSWDDVYGGAFRCLYNVDANEWAVDKVLWLQEEVLIGSLFAWEHTGADWARDWFSRMYTYVIDKYPLEQYGFPLWILGADRKMTFVRNYGRVGNFHHPRHLMLNLLALDRIIERGGPGSGLFA